MNTTPQKSHSAVTSHSLGVQLRRALAVVLFGVAFSACGDGGGGGGTGSGDAGVRITKDGTTHAAETSASFVNSMWLASGDDEEFYTTVIAGWTKGGDFGTVTLRLNLRGADGKPVGTGTYALVADDFSSEAMTAQLKVEARKFLDVEENLVGATGTLTLKTLDKNGDDKLKRIGFEFDGGFVASGDSDDPNAARIQLSGDAFVAKD